jgi:hypothetical protein
MGTRVMRQEAVERRTDAAAHRRHQLDIAPVQHHAAVAGPPTGMTRKWRQVEAQCLERLSEPIQIAPDHADMIERAGRGIAPRHHPRAAISDLGHGTVS